MNTFKFNAKISNRPRPVEYKLRADMEIRITSIGGFAVKKDGWPITRSNTVMKRLRREAKLDYMRNMRERAGA